MPCVNLDELKKTTPLVEPISRGETVTWINPSLQPAQQALREQELHMADIDDAEARLKRFAPFIRRCFPETADRDGLIESDLVPIPKMQALLNRDFGVDLPGTLLLKQDSHLAIAGSVKARGGIYEVLKHTEELAFQAGILTKDSDYTLLASPECKAFFSQYTIQVGSTGNLGMSIGIASAAIGYRVIVHMSMDAKQWKKDLLRQHGVTVVEYASDYGAAVKQGRALSEADPKSYFVDDENSRDLFLGYAVAAKRLPAQLRQVGVKVDGAHPLFVYIPCGVGGAPGGVTFGLKQVFGDLVHCFFVEPTQAPCMLLGMATGLNSDISVQDVGLSGLTEADGLAVGRPSAFVGGVMRTLLSGEVTVEDATLYRYMRGMLQTQNIFLEPSACAGFEGPVKLMGDAQLRQYPAQHGLEQKMAQATHIVWATGGALVPQDVREAYQKKYLD